MDLEIFEAFQEAASAYGNVNLLLTRKALLQQARVHLNRCKAVLPIV
jgi:hypothetical protein